MKSDLVIEYLDLSIPPQYSEEELKMLEELDHRPIVYDEDCPPLTEAQIAKFRQSRPKATIGAAS